MKETLSALLLGLYVAHRVDSERWLAYSRNKTDYGPARRYTHPDLTARSVTTTVDFLVASGLAEHRRGSFTRNPFGGPGGSGFQSRIRARETLVALLEERFELSLDVVAHAPWAEIVRLKAPAEYYGGPKRLVGYDDTAETRAMRRQLRDLNAFLRGFSLDLPAAGSQEADWSEMFDHDDRTDTRDRSAVRLYRVFNNGRWDHGGRFYGGWWQGVAKRDRRRLLINGEDTVELDFKALHPRLCYQLAGQPLARGVDPYSLPGLQEPQHRSLIKVAFNQLLNVTHGATPRAPVGARQVLPRGLGYRALLGQIEAAHATISRWFRAGRGLELQRIDSDIASHTLDYLRQEGVCCLPLHDSFIVPRSSEFILGEAMCRAYDRTLREHTPLTSPPIISGWTSDRIEREVMDALHLQQPLGHY